jgi:hypothetical protein
MCGIFGLASKHQFAIDQESFKIALVKKLANSKVKSIKISVFLNFLSSAVHDGT